MRSSAGIVFAAGVSLLSAFYFHQQERQSEAVPLGSIRVDALTSGKFQIIGLLGRPLGAVSRVKGYWKTDKVVGKYYKHDPLPYFIVVSINGAEIEPITYKYADDVTVKMELRDI